MLLADDIWLHTWHPWLIHTSLMHRNCFFRHSLVWCIHRSMEESTFPLVCSAKLKLMCATVFRALFSCTGLSDLSFMFLNSTHNLMPKAASRDFMFTWNNTNHVCLHVQSFLICEAYWLHTTVLQTHKSGIYPFKCAIVSTCKAGTFESAQKSSALFEAAMLDHDLRGQMKHILRAPSSSRYNSE